MFDEENITASGLMKEGLNAAAITRIANSIAQIIPNFNAAQFQKDAENGLQVLELKQRVKHIIQALHRHYPHPYKKLSQLLLNLPEVWDKGSADNNKAMFAAWPVIDYVAAHGLAHPKESLQLLEKLTPLFSAEFAVRPFIQQHYELSYRQLLTWCEHDNEHVRRLASEGSRPRLPWGMRLPEFMQNPKPLAPILNVLHQDKSLYVRRSVANNVNDIGKDNPDWAIALCEKWKQDNHAASDWVVKHALRSLIKAGDVRVFPLLGYSSAQGVKVNQLQVQQKKLSLGDDLHFSFALEAGSQQHNLVVDYVIYFMKANGKLSPKVFKLKNILLEKKSRIVIQKKQSFKPISTRVYYSGLHQLAIQVNGKEMARVDFILR